MNSSGPGLSTLRLWTKRKQMCLAILRRGLHLLSAQADLPQAEVDLNRRLYFCLLAATRELYPHETVGPTSECNNQPDPDDTSRAEREQKRPDFQWSYVDRYEPDPNRSCKQFVVECKRLGKASRSDWVLNVNYVHHGICRFRDPHWAYAQRFESAAMVGYCQNMGFGEILKDVNAEVRKNAFPDLAPNGDVSKALTCFEHAFERGFDISPFKLAHLWIDLCPAANAQ